MAGQNRLEVEVVKAVRAPVVPAFARSVLERAASLPELVARLPAETATVAVRITSDEELRRLNRSYAGNDSVTDVLSFAGSENHLGDLAISWPMVERQAVQYGQPVLTEVALLCVHGMLHLLGWDHVSASERREMSRLTVAALKLSGLRLAPRRL
ncbi:MAG TPA: rRNA maturation RNase YbeY [Candidatus Dormibacteraeota bacterium]|nr:rRNA maturation RNase YbeY [Candidatus Dormibacteraeota bacterium]